MPSGIQVGWGKQWETLANAINDYYGGGISSAQYQQVVQMLNSGEYTMEEMESIIGNIPEFSRTYNSAGQLTQVSYNATAAGNTAAGAAANALNSNVAGAAQTQFKTVQNVTKNAQTGKVTMSDTVTKYNAGTATTAKAVAANAISAIAATSVGISVGKSFDQRLYNSNPQFWDSHGMSTLNPQTWSSITAGENTLGATLFNFVFGITPNNNPQPYMDETAFAYMVAYMMSQGAFDTGDTESVLDDTSPLYNPSSFPDNSIYTIANTLDYHHPSNLTGWTYHVTCAGNCHFAAVNYDRSDSYCAFSNQPFNIVVTKQKYDGSTSTSTYNGSAVTRNGITFYCYFIDSYSNPLNDAYANVPFSNILNTFNSASLIWDCAYMYYYGVTTTSGGIEGIESQTGATQFNPAGIDPSNIAAVLAALMTQFPELWANRMEISPDGENVIKYIPVGFPTGGVGTQPTTDGATANDLAPDITGDGQNSTDELIKTLIDMLQNPHEQSGMESDTTTPTAPIDPNMPTTGGGVTPPFIIPTGSASALYSVYNPSQAQLNSLGAWLWSSNFVDQLLKLFNDPMQAIIGLHKVFATPPTSGASTIKVGYLDSGVSSNLVSSQYTEIDCGTVKLDEYFKNALDYVKTDVYLYLPFIGIVSLNVEDVTRANINVKYKVDVLTGACLASVNVTRDAGGGGQLYAYAGNCAVQYPLSSGSYMGIVSGILGIAGSIASTVASGGAMLPMALGVGASAMGNMKTRVEHSGSLSGNSGAMGIKKPYLIVRRPQTKIADNYPHLAGGSDNTYGVLSSFTGHVRVKYVHIENIPATSDELNEIETLLKSGVMI